ncbi:S26 family signal peptidase [Burkholderia glumae]|uniref:S26 family signal peptidase n=1 Tax=Burkholderia glumae TaxID=337 RepID=UPI0001A4A4E7|nr:S26 family signal peptidase [Burkholderia glumae]ACR32803.1 Type IV secretory pathway protease TraF-like protein [Burkholderia glumae BGR1]UVT05800.1 peptidase S26 [Burkholderia glumae]
MTALAIRLARYRRLLRTLAILLLTAAFGWGIRPWYALGFNLSTSLPGTLYFIDKTTCVPRLGDTIAFRWRGGATYPAGVLFMKHVAGLPGDVVRVYGRNVWVNTTYIGYAKPLSLAGMPLFPTKGGVIPPGRYFVATPNPNSLDSRYAISGTVPQDAIVGKAYELF